MSARRLVVTTLMMAGCAATPRAPSGPVPPAWPAVSPEAGRTRASTQGSASAPAAPKDAPGAAAEHVCPCRETPQDTVDRTKAPEPGAMPSVPVPKVVRRKLRSGVPVWIVERRNLPMVTLGVLWRTGVTDDPAGKAGLAGLVADLLDEGAAGRDATAFSEEVARYGARLNTFASWDASGVWMTCLARTLDPVLGLLADVLTAPRFDPAELERVRQERLTQLVQSRDVPSEIAYQLVGMGLYGPQHRYGLPLNGDEVGLGSITVDEVRAFFAEHFGARGAQIVVVGDVSAADVVRRLDRVLGRWRPGPSRAASTSADRVGGGVRPQTLVVDRPGAAQTELRLAQPGVQRRHPDYFPLLVANTIFGGQFSSRLNMNLREKHGYTYGARSALAFRRQGGPTVVASPVKTAVTREALGEMMKELERFRTEAPSDEELRHSKDTLERGLTRAFETAHAVSTALMDIWVYDLPQDYFSTYQAKVEAVTAADVQRVAGHWFDPDKMSLIAVGDVAQIGEVIKAVRGGYELRDTAGAPVAADK